MYKYGGAAVLRKPQHRGKKKKDGERDPFSDLGPLPSIPCLVAGGPIKFWSGDAAKILSRQGPDELASGTSQKRRARDIKEREGERANPRCRAGAPAFPRRYLLGPDEVLTAAGPAGRGKEREGFLVLSVKAIYRRKSRKERPERLGDKKYQRL